MYESARFITLYNIFRFNDCIWSGSAVYPTFFKIVTKKEFQEVAIVAKTISVVKVAEM